MGWFNFDNSALSGGMLGDLGFLTNPAKAWDTFKNGTVNETNERIAQENLAYQYENLDYQKALNQTIFDRADTSYQRTVNDMYNAGLNPLTMTGTNEVGSPIATEAPHNDFQAQDKGIAQALTEVLGVGNAIEDWQIGQQKLRQETATAEQMETEANFKNMFLEDEINKRKRQYDLDEKSYKDFLRNYEFNEKHSIFNGMGENEKLAKLLSDPKTDGKLIQNLQLNAMNTIVGDVLKAGKYGLSTWQQTDGKTKEMNPLDYLKLIFGM